MYALIPGLELGDAGERIWRWNVSFWCDGFPRGVTPCFIVRMVGRVTAEEGSTDLAEGRSAGRGRWTFLSVVLDLACGVKVHGNVAGLVVDELTVEFLGKGMLDEVGSVR